MFENEYENEPGSLVIEGNLPNQTETMDEVKTPKAKPGRKKGTGKPATTKPSTDGPIYLLLAANGKYKELTQDQLQSEAAGLFKDSSLRLVKASFLLPELSFKLAGE